MASAATSRHGGFKFVTKDYSSIHRREHNMPYLPGKTRRLTRDEARRFKIRDGPALHFCDSAIDCLGYVAEWDLYLGQSVLDCDAVNLRLLRVSVPNDGSEIQRIVGQYGRKCASTGLRVDAEVTDRDELAALFRGTYSVLAVDTTRQDLGWLHLNEWRFVDGRYVAGVVTDEVGNIVYYRSGTGTAAKTDQSGNVIPGTSTATTVIEGRYTVITDPDVPFYYVGNVVTAVTDDHTKIQYRQDGIVVKTYAAGELRELFRVGSVKFAAMCKEQETVVYE